MIIEPDFVDHWKTRLLVGLLGDNELAPIYLIRLWAHCQQRKTSTFDSLPTLAIKAICRFTGDAEVFEAALIGSGFIAREGAALHVLGWDEYNASLIANWTNGGKGGRPKKNPTETHGLSTGAPEETQGVSDREEKSREDKTEKTNSKAKAAPKARKPTSSPLPVDFSVSDGVRAWAEKNGHGNLQAHLESFICKAKAKGYTYADWDQAFQNAIREDWAKLKAPHAGAGPPIYQTANDKAKDIAERLTGKKRNEQPDLIDINERPS